MMTIGQVLDKLKTFDSSLPVYFDFAYCVPTTVNSWRGNYAEPAIGWGNAEDCAPDVEALACRLEFAIDDRRYYHWKGGTYRYTRDHVLHVDNPGVCSNTEIVRIEDRGGRVIIHTEKVDD